MRKLLFILIMLPGLGMPCFSQGGFFRYFRYGSPMSENQVLCVREHPNGNYIVLFRYEDATSEGIDFGFYTLSPNGDSIGTQGYRRPGNDYPEDFIIDNEGIYRLSGTHKLLNPPSDSRKLFYTINPSNSIQDQYHVYPNPTGYSGGDRIYKHKDQYCIFGSKTISPYSRFNLFRVTANGVVTLDSVYGGSNSDFANTGALTIDGGYILAGGSFSYSTEQAKILVIKTDSTGHELWRKSIGLERDSLDICRVTAEGILQADNGNYYIAAQNSSHCDLPRGRTSSLLLCLDSTGKQLWIREDRFVMEGTYNGKPYYSKQQWSDIVRLKDGGLLCMGTIQIPIAAQPDKIQLQVLLAKYDLDGNLTWKRILGDSTMHELCYGIHATSDGGAILTGRYEEALNPFQDVRTFVMKVDPCGCVVPGCDPNCISTGMAVERRNAPVIYPNPANNTLYIRSDTPIAWYRVMNILGATVLQGQVQDNTLSVQEVKRGVYIIELWDTGGNSFFEKIIKE
mgnify:CR=1 FL=1